MPTPLTNPKRGSTRNWPALGAGAFLLTLAAGMVVLSSENPVAWAIGFFAFLVGIALVMMNAMDIPSKKEASPQTEQRPVVRIRCTHCDSLNLETSLRCSNCGAKL